MIEREGGRKGGRKGGRDSSLHPMLTDVTFCINPQPLHTYCYVTKGGEGREGGKEEGERE